MAWVAGYIQLFTEEFYQDSRYVSVTTAPVSKHFLGEWTHLRDYLRAWVKLKDSSGRACVYVSNMFFRVSSVRAVNVTYQFCDEHLSDYC